VARLTGTKLDLAALIDEAGRLLAQALPFDGACWHTIDPATLIETSFRAVNLPDLDALVAENEYLHDDFNRYSVLARSRRHSGLLSEATAGDLNRSRRYREFLLPSGVRGELRTSFVVDGACWGSVAIFRAAPVDFSAEERDFAHELAANLGRGFRAALVQPQAPGGSVAAAPGPGVLLLDRDQRVESITAAARSWLVELGLAGEPGRGRLPHVLVAVADRARATGGDAAARVRGRSGQWVGLHASAASGGDSGRVAVILQSPTAASIAPLIAAAYGLTSRERELTELVLQGYPTGDIAARLFISAHTVQEHLKSIFAKAGVHSRRELVGNLFLRHYQPTIQPIGRIPEPVD